MEPKVSVIIPVYNVEKYLGPCLDSILGQTLNNIEVICVDDGSTDRSLDILREYEKRDARVKVLTQPNTNAGAARNKGIQQARGEYLSFLDSDDHFDPTMLEKCAARMDQTDLMCWCSGPSSTTCAPVSSRTCPGACAWTAAPRSRCSPPAR